MNKAYKFAAVMGMGLALASVMAMAQAPAPQGTPAAVIPADQQPTNAQLTKLFEVMRIRQQMQGFMAMMPNMVKQQIQEQIKQSAEMSPNKLTAEQQAQVQKLMEKYMQKSFGLLSVDEMLGDMTPIYQRHLSRSDVDALIAFYESPAGKHFLNEQPAIMQEYMPTAMQRVQGRARELTAELMKEMADITKSPAPKN